MNTNSIFKVVKDCSIPMPSAARWKSVKPIQIMQNKKGMKPDFSERDTQFLFFCTNIYYF